MKREILFRGKQVDSGNWVYGYLWSSRTIAVESPVGNVDEVIVYPSTIGQYTGLTDRKGQRIFEGDIVKYIYEPGNGFWNANQLSVIVWDHTGFKLDGIMRTNKYALLQGWLVSIPCSESFFEVIGNIHDNPELLGGNDGTAFLSCEEAEAALKKREEGKPG